VNFLLEECPEHLGKRDGILGGSETIKDSLECKYYLPEDPKPATGVGEGAPESRSERTLAETVIEDRR
jgi:hypothetical protein